MFVRYHCADVQHCGRPFMAYEEVESVSCPYCGELATIE